MIYNARELTLTVQGMTFEYSTFGSGTKPLVMIQGLNTRGIKGASAALAWMYRIFAKDYTVYLFDRRPVAQPDITVQTMADDLALAMDTLGISHAAVYGVSQGGMIAQYLAIQRPDLVSKMVLAVTLSRNNETVKQVISGWIDMAERGAMKELIEDMTVKMYSDAYVKRYRPFLPLLTFIQKPKNVERFIILAKACLTCNTYELLDNIKCPVLVVGGRLDQIVTGEASMEIAQKLQCRIHMYDQFGHAAYEEAKDINQIIYDFFTTPTENTRL